MASEGEVNQIEEAEKIASEDELNVGTDESFSFSEENLEISFSVSSDGDVAEQLTIGWTPPQEPSAPIELFPQDDWRFPMPPARQEGPVSMTKFFMKRIWVLVQSHWWDFVYVHPMHSRTEDVLLAWARRMRVHPECVEVVCGDEEPLPPWTSVITHRPPGRPQLYLPGVKQPPDEVQYEYAAFCLQHPIWVDIIPGKVIERLPSSDSERSSSTKYKIGVVSQDNKVLDFRVYPTTPMIWVKQIYRLIMHEKFGHEGTGFFHNRLEVEDTANCIKLRMTDESTISVVAHEVLEQARLLQLERQEAEAKQTARQPPPRRANKKAEKAGKSPQLSAAEVEAARKRADELMESLIREEDQRQERQQLRKQKAEAKARENHRKMEEERRERERAAQGLSGPSLQGQASSDEDDGEALGGGFVMLEGAGASREEVDGEEMARWTAAEEAASARRAKEKARKAAKKEKRLASAKQQTPDAESPTSRLRDEQSSQAASQRATPRFPSGHSPSTPPASGRIHSEGGATSSQGPGIGGPPIGGNAPGLSPAATEALAALKSRLTERPRPGRLAHHEARSPVGQGRAGGLQMAERGREEQDTMELMAFLGLSAPEDTTPPSREPPGFSSASGNRASRGPPPGMRGPPAHPSHQTRGPAGYRDIQYYPGRGPGRPQPGPILPQHPGTGLQGEYSRVVDRTFRPPMAPPPQRPPPTASRATPSSMHRALGGGGGALDPGDSSDEDYFSDLYCPLTLEVMTDPVVCADGISYEREAINKWLQDHDTSPKTNLVLPNKLLLPNRALANLCRRLRTSQLRRSR